MQLGPMLSVRWISIVSFHPPCTWNDNIKMATQPFVKNWTYSPHEINCKFSNNSALRPSGRKQCYAWCSSERVSHADFQGRPTALADDVQKFEDARRTWWCETAWWNLVLTAVLQLGLLPDEWWVQGHMRAPGSAPRASLWAVPACSGWRGVRHKGHALPVGGGALLRAFSPTRRGLL